MNDNPSRRSWLLLGMLAILAGAAPFVPRVAAAEPEPLSAFPQSLLAIRTASGKVINFKVWIADTPAREEQGLMFVRHIDDHAGMLFVFSQDQQLSMWMKNTLLSLDMLFIDAHGRINALVASTTPESTAIIAPPEPARAVLELLGGSGQALGIHVGDTVVHHAFNNAK